MPSLWDQRRRVYTTAVGPNMPDETWPEFCREMEFFENLAKQEALQEAYAKAAAYQPIPVTGMADIYREAFVQTKNSICSLISDFKSKIESKIWAVLNQREIEAKKK